MNTYIQQSIDSRRRSLYSTYSLPDDVRVKAEEVFTRMEQLGASCNEPAEFEELLSVSPINEEYNNLFVQYARYVNKPESTPSMGEMAGQAAKSSARSTIKHQAEIKVRSTIFRMLPDGARNWWTYGIYNVPILGSIVSSINTAFNVKRLFGLNKKEESTDTNDEENED